MLKNAIKSINNLYEHSIIISCLLAAATVLAIDYFTGRHIQFPIAYILPIGMAAWQEKKLMAYAMALFLPLMRVGFFFPWNEAQSIHFAVYNAMINISALTFYAYLVNRTAWQTRLLRKKVKILEGILPICASCKRIRTEKGEYVQMEKFITERSEASFSHGICPECAQKLYPEYFKGKQKQSFADNRSMSQRLP